MTHPLIIRGHTSDFPTGLDAHRPVHSCATHSLIAPQAPCPSSFCYIIVGRRLPSPTSFCTIVP